MPPRKSRRGPGRPPRSAGEDRDSRTRLLEAAERVFSARGFRGATVAAIVDDAGLSKGTFYWNFESKDDLFLTLLEERIERPFMAVLEAVESAPAGAAVSPLASRLLENVLDHQRDLMRLAFEYWSQAMRDDRVRERYRKWHAGLASAVATALAARHEATGVPSTMDFDELATSVIALAQGFTLLGLIDRQLLPDGAYSEILGLVWDGFVLRAERDS